MLLPFSRSSQSLDSRLDAYPELKAKIEGLVSVVENTNGTLTNAHEAEQEVINEIQRLGQAALQGWANQESQRQQQRVEQSEPMAQRSRKKPSTGTAASDVLASKSRPLP
ncbi:MAG: hypothetical protein AAGG02_21200 [Cyanobacteria bacterium P01_H01_bin.15]